jgi:hypothetical protein
MKNPAIPLNYRYSAISLSLPSCILDLCYDEATKLQSSVSHAVATLLARALGMDSNDVPRPRQTHRKQIDTAAAAAKARAAIKTKGLPLNLIEFNKDPFLPKSIYSLILMEGATWGDGSPVSPKHRESIRLSRDVYSI